MTSPKPMGPIERELRDASSHMDPIYLSPSAYNALVGARISLRVEVFPSERLVPDIWSEAIEAASELGL